MNDHGDHGAGAGVPGLLAAAIWTGTALLALPMSQAGADPFLQAWQEVAPGVHVGIREDSPRIRFVADATLIDEDEAVARLELGTFEPRFTGGDEFLESRFEVWFRQPIARAAHRIARGEPPETNP